MWITERPSKVAGKTSQSQISNGYHCYGWTGFSHRVGYVVNRH